MNKKDTNDPIEMLHYISDDGCLKCSEAYPGINCSRCRKKRYVERLEEDIVRMKSHYCEYASDNHGCSVEDKNFPRIVELQKTVKTLESALKPILNVNMNMGANYSDMFFAVREAQRIYKEVGAK